MLTSFFFRGEENIRQVIQILSVATGARIGIEGAYFRRSPFHPFYSDSSKRTRSTDPRK